MGRPPAAGQGPVRRPPDRCRRAGPRPDTHDLLWCDAGGTITHHHSLGPDHRKWYDQEVPPLYRDVIRATKNTLDPKWVLNPGILLDQ